MHTIRIRESSPLGLRSVVEARVTCDCGWEDKAYADSPHFGINLANLHNLRKHGDKYRVVDERVLRTLF
jgi:hypothetical protein